MEWLIKRVQQIEHLHLFLKKCFKRCETDLFPQKVWQACT